MPSATLTARVSRLEAIVESFGQKLPLHAKPTPKRGSKPPRSFRMKSLSAPPLEGLPADLSIGTREKARDIFKARHATHR
ncbi:MAG: hypothetical protein ACKVY0_12510 [Prosthecobacter sp.]|uniref:hypothetical protein n=1 Tax=Prosthecobacter sp. TaxID=1965333 RepID=UPI0039017F40